MSSKQLNIPPAAGIAAGVALGAVAVGAAVAVGSQCLQLVRTKGGMARVKTVQAARGERVRVLQQGGVYQGATYLDKRRFNAVFAYIRAFDTMFQADDALRATEEHGIERVLMLGGGGFSYPKHALTTHPELSMDVVEIDPAVVRLARRWFFLDELEKLAGERLGLITADARAHLAQAIVEGTSYDAIVNDCFSGAAPTRSVATLEALLHIKACLRPGGLYLANVVSTNGGEDIGFLRDVVATTAAVFASVQVIPCEDEVFGGEDNYLVIASDTSYVFEGTLPFDGDFPGTVLRD